MLVHELKSNHFFSSANTRVHVSLVSLLLFLFIQFSFPLAPTLIGTCEGEHWEDMWWDRGRRSAHRRWNRRDCEWVDCNSVRCLGVVGSGESFVCASSPSREELAHCFAENNRPLSPDLGPIYFSFIGHSLGGLYGRYCLGELYRR
jgi:hypothetical protein